MLIAIGVALLAMGKTMLLIVPWGGLTIGAAIESDEREHYNYITPRDLGTEPYGEE